MAVKGSNWSSYGVPVLLIIAFGLLLLLQQTDLFRPSGPLKSGLEGVLVEQMALEPFLMPPDDQSGPKTDADLQGKITFISFWATWCGPCLRELPHLGAIVDQFDTDPEVQVWTILHDDPPNERTRATVVSLFKKNEIALPVYLLSGPLVPNSLLPRGIPFALLIGPDSKVIAAWSGYNPNLESEVAKLVDELREAKLVEVEK